MYKRQDFNIITVRLSLVSYQSGCLFVSYQSDGLLVCYYSGCHLVCCQSGCQSSVLFSCRQWWHRWQWNVHYCPPVRLGARDVTLCVAPSADPLYHVTKADCDDIASCSENIILHNFVLKDHSFTQCLFVNRIKLSIDRANVSEIRSQFKGLLNSTWTFGCFVY